jgi:hypothetical protein
VPELSIDDDGYEDTASLVPDDDGMGHGDDDSTFFGSVNSLTPEGNISGSGADQRRRFGLGGPNKSSFSLIALSSGTGFEGLGVSGGPMMLITGGTSFIRDNGFSDEDPAVETINEVLSFGLSELVVFGTLLFMYFWETGIFFDSVVVELGLF